MSSMETLKQTAAQKAEHFDVVIVGAGISGVGGAYHFTKQCPATSFVVLEVQESFGGTWLTHRFPGIRSDSDLYTFGYRFKPWTGPPIATAAEILAYMGEVIDENDLGQHIRYQHKISSACWSSAENLWALEATRTDTGEEAYFTANFLWMCQGYYRHSQGYTPA
jgi:cation diffusion facilitator CzcD-associated flavoprotein CzcO